MKADVGTPVVKSGLGEFLRLPPFGRRLGGAAEYVVIPVLALLASLVLFGIFVASFGKNPIDLYFYMYQGAFGTWFSWQNTLTRAAPLILTALCTALPAQLGMVIIGGEGALLIGALCATSAALAMPAAPPLVVDVAMAIAGMIGGGLWILLAGALRQFRGVNETISSLLLVYIALAILNFLVEGPMRDPTSLNKPSTPEIGAANMIGSIPGTDVHWGLAFGIIAAVASYILIYHTVFGFAARVAGGNIRAAKVVGLSVGKLILIVCFLAGAAAGLAGMMEVAAVQGRTNANLAAGYGFAGILVAFLARQNPLAVIPVAVLLGGIGASGGLLQRRLGLPDASVLVLQGMIFVMVLASDTLYGRLSFLKGKSDRISPDHGRHGDIGLWTVPLAVLGGAVRVSTPFLFVSLGECITERSGRINLGLEGTLVMGAMAGYGVSYLTGSPWLGVLAAGIAGAGMGALHAGICGLPRVNDIAVGIALMLFGVGLAFYLGKPLIEPTAPRLPSIDFGWWSDIPQVRAALRINVLFLFGVALAPILVWALRTTRWGLIIRTAGESADAALAMGYSVNMIRLRATMFGGFLAGIGGSFLSLFYPGSWNEGLSSGQGITAVALVIFARWNPMLCLWSLAAVRRRRRARPGAAVDRLQLWLSSVQRRALYSDVADHDRDLFAQAHAGRRAGGTVDHAMSC